MHSCYSRVNTHRKPWVRAGAEGPPINLLTLNFTCLSPVHLRPVTLACTKQAGGPSLSLALIQPLQAAHIRGVEVVTCTWRKMLQIALIGTPLPTK